MRVERLGKVACHQESINIKPRRCFACIDGFRQQDLERPSTRFDTCRMVSNISFVKYSVEPVGVPISRFLQSNETGEKLFVLASNLCYLCPACRPADGFRWTTQPHLATDNRNLVSPQPLLKCRYRESDQLRSIALKTLAPRLPRPDRKSTRLNSS